MTTELPKFEYQEIDGRKTLKIDPQAVGAWFGSNFLTKFHMQTKAVEAKALLENSLYQDVVTSTRSEIQKLIVEKANSVEELQHYRTCLTVLMLIETKLQMIADMKIDTSSTSGDTSGTGPDIARVTD